MRDGFAWVDLRDDALTQGPRVESDEPGMRMNDAACDAAGRCFAGTMEFDGSGRPGTLYRLDPDLSVRPVLDGFGVSNGIGWSLSGESMYHIDSHRHRVDVHDYDASTGTPSNGRPLVRTDVDWGAPRRAHRRRRGRHLGLLLGRRRAAPLRARRGADRAARLPGGAPHPAGVRRPGPGPALRHQRDTRLRRQRPRRRRLRGGARGARPARARVHAAVRPPSMTSAEPVTKLLAGDAR